MISISNHTAMSHRPRTTLRQTPAPRVASRFGADTTPTPPASPTPPPALPDPRKEFVKGLAGIIAGVTQIAEVDPVIHSLIYRGHDIQELVNNNASFEEVTHLLLKGKLPNAAELAETEAKIRSQRELPPQVLKTIRTFPKNSDYMDILRTTVSMLGQFDPDAAKNDKAANVEKAIRLTAQMPTILAASYRILNGKRPVKPDPKLNQAENFLYMLTGKKPDPFMAKVFNATMLVYAEHGFNASTFSSRVTASTQSDLHSAITSAIGTLKGPLHGGANQEVMKTLLEIGSEDKVESWVKQALAEKKIIMGFGHALYKNGDTRAPILKKMAHTLSQRQGEMKWYNMAETFEKTMMAEKKLQPNVDFHMAYIYHLMGIPIELYTPLFAAARVIGWSAHAMEQLDLGKNSLIRPQSLYAGPRGNPFLPVEKRS